MPSSKYPDAGARDLLRSAVQRRTREYHEEERAQRARSTASAELLDAALELFVAYGLKFEKFPTPHDKNPAFAGTWSVSTDRMRGWLLLRPDDNGDFNAFWWRDGRERPSAFTCQLCWDDADGVWLGSELEGHDFSAPGYPRRRESALETLTRALIAELKLGVEA